ncbi:hypothetical protein [Methylobacterium dankookense]|uniref:Uncharacterized protein n=1 Tax=Methylobacterium dankookense TaxID=560405 RepID=A0A564FV97_9HYPH|nr:hypothetical protein [Methylobacterium dankookense]GJD56780.1 hypothetical protein IFDJLNFL_2677 [Methylobacterium dankookense]VUF11718.1 hypothetical protein MTDSW087_01402 [Methylobacterium dankookense]
MTANDNPSDAQRDARIVLRNWPRLYECRVSYLSGGLALVTTNLARDLPSGFSLAVAPDFTPRPCSVVWRGKRAVEVVMFDETRSAGHVGPAYDRDAGPRRGQSPVHSSDRHIHFI